MSAKYQGPRIGGLVIVQGPLCRVVEMAARDGVPGAVVTGDGVTSWLPLAWLINVPLDETGGRR